MSSFDFFLFFLFQFLTSNFLPQTKKEAAPAAAPIMHPLFGSAEQQQFSANDQMYQQQPAYGGQQFAPVQGQVPPPTNNAMPQTGFYQPPQQPSSFQQPVAQVNYQNFQQNFNGQQQPQQTMSPPPPVRVQSPPKQKLPIPEEFIYMQTVLEELKTQCIAAALNPVSLFIN